MPVNIFLCYAHEDKRLLNKLEAQLRSLQRQNLVDIWSDRDIKAGDEWQHEIDTRLNSAQVILLLVSPDFMDSDYCYSIEMKRAMELHEQGIARVIPIILRPSLWENTPFHKLQALPTNAKPVTRWRNLDMAFLDIAKGISKIIEETFGKATDSINNLQNSEGSPQHGFAKASEPTFPTEKALIKSESLPLKKENQKTTPTSDIQTLAEQLRRVPLPPATLVGNMKHKLLVLTSGTAAAGVGIELLKQLDARPESKLSVMVRFLDIARILPSVYGGNILVGEWMPMQINEQFIQFIQEHPDKLDEELKNFFYPKHPPRTESAGGGGVRYYGAGAVLLNREELIERLAGSMDMLVQRDGGPADLSVILVVSPVGATGSGSVERLIKLILGAAVKAGLSEEVHCDVFILQPGPQNIKPLMLANTFALYAEMAASRMLQGDLNYKGRTIMIGWGTDVRITSLTQLRETTATLIRILNDPVSDVAAEYRKRERDHSVLIAKDRQTHLPSHLSTATCVTMTLGDLKEQIIRYDTSRILSILVHGDEATKALEGGANIFQDALVSCLSGEDISQQYKFLLDQIEKVIELRSLQTSADELKGTAEKQLADLEDLWAEDTRQLKTETQVPQQLQEEGQALRKEIVDEMDRRQKEALAVGYSLARIEKDYEYLRRQLDSLLMYAQQYAMLVDNDDDVRKAMKLENMKQRQGGKQALKAIQKYVEGLLKVQTDIAARRFLRELYHYCGDVIGSLKAIQQATPRVNRASKDKSPLSIQINHPLQMSALTPDQILSYYEQVSVFATQVHGSEDFSTNEDEKEGEDALADVRRWLTEKNLLDLPFAGGFTKFSKAVEMYTRKTVGPKVKNCSVLDVLLQASPDKRNILEQQLSEAAIKAQSSIKFNPKLAEDRAEKWYICAYYKKKQFMPLQATVNKAFGQGECSILHSDDPTEIAVVHYIDGLPMSSITDLTGRCLKEFLRYRKDWYDKLESGANGADSAKDSGLTDLRPGSIPVYSGQDTENLVRETKVVQQVYSMRDRLVVAGFNPANFPELGGTDKAEHHQDEG